MEQEKYKLIIIGSGITGLSTGLAWTKIYNAVENPVLIIEKHTVPGGCVSTFAREGYRFDTVQIIPDVSDILEFYNIDIELIKFDNYYARLFLADPKNKIARIFPIHSELEKFKDNLIGFFPDDRVQINRFFNYCSKMHAELQYLKTEPRLYEFPGILFRCPKILANSGKTYKEFLSGFNFRNPEIYEILDTFSTFSGLSGNRCAALLTACAMITTLNGSYRTRKGFIEFPVQLKKKFEENGGQIMLNTIVEKILTDEGKAKGVRLADGRELYAENVVSTTDTKLTFGKLLGYDVLEKADSGYEKKVRELRMSPSAITIHAGLDDKIDLRGMGFDCGYNVLTTGRKTHEKLFDDWSKGNFILSDEDFHCGVIAPCLKTGGKPNLIIRVVPVAANNWIKLRKTDIDAYNKEKQKFADFYISKVEEYMISNLRKHITFIDVASPATYERYLGTPTGSNYDMLPVPNNFGRKRLKTRTPVKNLYHPKFSHGIWPSMQAGLQVVDMISGRKIMNGNASFKKRR